MADVLAPRPNRRRPGCVLHALTTSGLTVAVSVLLVSAALSSPLAQPGLCQRSPSPLVRAAGRGEVDIVRRQLDAGVSPGTVDADGVTALGCALRLGRDDVARLLLERGADPNQPTGRGAFTERPLEVAMRQGSTAVRVELVERGADPDAFTPSRHRRPVIEAILAKDVVTLRALLDRGADPDGVAGDRPLYEVAAHTDDIDLFDALVAAGADPALPVDAGTPTSIADAALGVSAGNGRVAMVQRLLAAGAHPDGDAGMTPLLRAAFAGHLDVVAVLLDAGASPDTGDVPGPTLAVAAGAVASPAVRAALTSTSADAAHPAAAVADRAGDPANAGAPLDVIDPAPVAVPPLAAAIAQRDLATAALLLEHGADPDRVVAGTFRPLDLAVADCNVPMVELLRGRGAHPTPLATRSPLLPPVCPELAAVVPG